jgi:ubiquinone/menaquinone biosynthesis C-methylase UbiE
MPVSESKYRSFRGRCCQKYTAGLITATVSHIPAETLEHDDFAKLLMSKERKKWQNPTTIVKYSGVHEGMAVADLGCGPGFFTVPMASAVAETGVVYAVDSDPLMLEHLRAAVRRSGVHNVEIIQADIKETGIASRKVDVAFFANVFHDISDKGAFLNEVKRICKRTGRAVDVDWKKVRSQVGPPYALRLAEGEARRMLEHNGFRVLRRFNAGPYHYGLVCQPNR